MLIVILRLQHADDWIEISGNAEVTSPSENFGREQYELHEAYRPARDVQNL